MLLLLDNHDSFTFNLYQYLLELGVAVHVVRNNAMDVRGVDQLAPAAIILSPGPGRPSDAGAMPAIVREFAGQIPMLGVCLGHQCIVEVLGGEVRHAPRVMHGMCSHVRHGGTALFRGIPSPIRVCRYHSLCTPEESLAGGVAATAWSDDGVVMAIEHPERRLWGVQFHPEAILTEHGHQLLANFLDMAGVAHGPVPVAPVVDGWVRRSD